MRTTRLIATVIAAATALAACGGGSTTDAASVDNDQADPASATIQIQDFGFGAALTVAPGETVTVINADGAPHTVTAEGGAFDTGSIAGGSTVAFTAPNTPGTYTFFCAIHPSMQGVLTVQG